MTPGADEPGTGVGEPAALRGDVAALVAGYARASGPSDDAAARMWQRLSAAPATVVPAANWPLRVGVALAAAALLVWAIAALPRLLAGVDAQDRDRDEAIDQDTREPAGGQAVPSEPPRPRAPVVAPVPAEPPPSELEREPEPESPARRSSKPTPKSKPTPIDALVRERELVAKAWDALGSGDDATARRWIKQHAREFPDGILGPERRAIAVILDCRAGRADATTRAQTWLEQQPRSPLSSRVREVCKLR
ncbi:MAG: hypothetical protein K1X88_12260 [Nannocystaceae bacterium]|nr:hypothetical protein [Nannocystaceae bacterium]